MDRVYLNMAYRAMQVVGVFTLGSCAPLMQEFTPATTQEKELVATQEHLEAQEPTVAPATPAIGTSSLKASPPSVSSVMDTPSPMPPFSIPSPFIPSPFVPRITDASPEPPAPPEPPALPEIPPETIDGLSEKSLIAMLGAPDYVRYEGAVQWWQYRTEHCTTDVLLSGPFDTIEAHDAPVHAERTRVISLSIRRPNAVSQHSERAMSDGQCLGLVGSGK